MQNVGTPCDPVQCAAGCGFFGNSSTKNLCSQCYRDLQQKQSAPASNESTAAVAGEKPSDDPMTPTILDFSATSPVATRLSFGDVSLSNVSLSSPEVDNNGEQKPDTDVKMEEQKPIATPETSTPAVTPVAAAVAAATAVAAPVAPAGAPSASAAPVTPASAPAAPAAAPAAPAAAFAAPATTPPALASALAPVAAAASPASPAAAAAAPAASEEEEKKPKKKVQKNKKRCFHPECRKKVGLTGIECKCGYIFCSKHRYPDQHNCDFDFKSHDRMFLAKSIPGGGQFSKMQKLQ